MTSILRVDLDGTGDDDILVGGNELNNIFGGMGGDLLVGAQGRDYLNGGEGDDTLIGGGLVSTNWNVDTDLEENILVDVFFFDEPHPGYFAELLVGGAGDDLIFGGSWDDENGDGEYLYADASVLLEQIVDGWGGEVSPASLGQEPFPASTEDLRLAEGFNNIVWAGEGDDTAFGADGYDTIGGGTGNDVLYGFNGADVMFGGAGDDVIYGGDGAALSLHREAGDPLVVSQKLYGGAGNDTVHGGDDDDVIMGGEGFDILHGRGGDDIMHGGDGFDMIYGGDGADEISGGASGDQLYGGNGDDTIDGGDGGDILQTGLGDNHLTGGDGEDYFFVESGGSNYVSDFTIGEDILLFIDIEEQLLVNAVVDAAEVETVDGVMGLMINMTAGSSVFLAGLTEADKADLNASANPTVTLM